jgi:hypothetical protein
MLGRRCHPSPSIRLSQYVDKGPQKNEFDCLSGASHGSRITEKPNSNCNFHSIDQQIAKQVAL